MAENDDPRQTDGEAGDKRSIFDLFDPPPERGPSTFGKIPIVRDEIDLTDGASAAEAKAAADAEAAGLQHWTAPATGQIPAVLSAEGDERGMWADVKGPSWQGEDPSWAGPDLVDVFADTDRVGQDIVDDEFDDDDYDEVEPDPVAVQRVQPPQTDQQPGRAPSPETQIGSPPARPRAMAPAPDRAPAVRHDNGAAQAAERAAQPQAQRRAPAPEAKRPAPAARHQQPASDSTDPVGMPTDPPDVARGAHDLQADAEAKRRASAPAGSGAVGYTDAPPSIEDIKFADNEYYGEPEEDDFGLGPTGGRDLPKAIGVGLALAALVAAAMWFGPYTTLALVVVLALLAVVELYNAMRLAGLRPATLLGIVGTVAAPAAAYYRGDAAYPLIMALAVIFGTLWYLVGADTERPVLNLSLTILGVFWVGGLASFAALMLRLDGGIELLLSAIIITVASDTMAYVGGRAYGSRPFHQASPNKTWEGTMTGFAGALFAGFAMGVTDMGSIWDGNLVAALALGAVVGVLAPIGDLAESVVKRDLGIKDMGTLLPGHGGVLDRVDGLLFALPGAYYLALVYGLI